MIFELQFREIVDFDQIDKLNTNFSVAKWIVHVFIMYSFAQDVGFAWLNKGH